MTEYDYFQEQIVKFIVMRGGGAAFGQSDREFTDWNALAHFVDVFLMRPRKGGLERNLRFSMSEALFPNVCFRSVADITSPMSYVR